MKLPPLFFLFLIFFLLFHRLWRPIYFKLFYIKKNQGSFVLLMAILLLVQFVKGLINFMDCLVEHWNISIILNYGILWRFIFIFYASHLGTFCFLEIWIKILISLFKSHCAVFTMEKNTQSAIYVYSPEERGNYLQSFETITFCNIYSVLWWQRNLPILLWKFIPVVF